jgi:hypothetical protein
MQLIDFILEDLKLLDHGGGSQSKSTDVPCKQDNKMNSNEGGKEIDYTWVLLQCDWNYELFGEVYLRRLGIQCSSVCQIHGPNHEKSQ